MKRTSLLFAIAFIMTGFLFIADAHQGKISQQSRRQTRSPKETKPAQKVPDEVLEAIKKLATNDPVERGFGLASLIKMGPQAAPAIPYLIGVLGDAREILAITSEPWAGKTTPHDLAIKVLTNIGKPAVGPLITALNSSDWYVRRNAADALGYLKDETAVAPLILLLMEQREKMSGQVRYVAAGALGKIQDKRAVEPLIKALSDPESIVQHGAIESLGMIRDKRAYLPIVSLYVKDGFYPSGNDVHDALSNIGSLPVDELLTALTNNPNKKAIAMALGLTKDKQAVEPLINVLLSENTPSTCDIIALALANINDARGIEPIIISSEKVADEDRNYRDRGFISRSRGEALNKLTGERFSEVKQWRQWWESNKGKFNKN